MNSIVERSEPPLTARLKDHIEPYSS